MSERLGAGGNERNVVGAGFGLSDMRQPVEGVVADGVGGLQGRCPRSSGCGQGGQTGPPGADAGDKPAGRLMGRIWEDEGWKGTPPERARA